MKGVTTYATIYDDGESIPRWTLHHMQEMVQWGSSRAPSYTAVAAAAAHGLQIEAFVRWDGHSYEMRGRSRIWEVTPALTGDTLNVIVHNDGTTDLEVR